MEKYNKKRSFSELKPGNKFVWGFGKFVKTANISESFNAISLKDGYAAKFSGRDLVYIKKK